MRKAISPSGPGIERSRTSPSSPRGMVNLKQHRFDDFGRRLLHRCNRFVVYRRPGLGGNEIEVGADIRANSVIHPSFALHLLSLYFALIAAAFAAAVGIGLNARNRLGKNLDSLMAAADCRLTAICSAETWAGGK
jgi:hypothetical protein